MNVIPDARTIRGFVIIAEDRDRLSGLHRTEQQRYQVRLRVVLFSETRSGLRSACVEVSAVPRCCAHRCDLSTEPKIASLPSASTRRMD